LTPLQDRPLAQLRPEQQGWRSPPQVWQVLPLFPDEAQTVPAAVHRSLPQQGCPVLPHATH
jgi:hypothetical protein